MNKKIMFFATFFSLVFGVVLITSVFAGDLTFTLNQVLNSQNSNDAKLMESYLLEVGYDLDEKMTMSELYTIYEDAPLEVISLFDESAFNFNSGNFVSVNACTHIKEGFFWDSAPYDYCSKTCASLSSCNACCNNNDYNEDEQRWCKRHCADKFGS